MTRRRKRLRAGGGHGADTAGGMGANNEGARSDIASHGEEDHAVDLAVTVFVQISLDLQVDRRLEIFENAIMKRPEIWSAIS